MISFKGRQSQREMILQSVRCDGFAWMTDLIDTSGHRATIQIPIAMRSILTPTHHPAVSSLEAYPTPAH